MTHWRLRLAKLPQIFGDEDGIQDMAGLLGKVDEFNPDLEEWPQYVERLEHFFEANGIVGANNVTKRRSTFLSVIGPGPYKLLQSLLTPDRPTDKTFEELTEILSKHYNPPPSEVMQRFRFNSRSRKAGESVVAYVADLRRLAEFCNFGTTLNKMIRDRLVCGVNCEGIQKELLSEKDLTFERALAIAQGLEEADRNLREMGAPSKAAPSASVVVKQEPVNQLRPSSGTRKKRSPDGRGQGSPSKTCHRCGRTGHRPNDCRFKEVSCNYCHGKGHIARACRNKDKKPRAKPVRQVTDEDTEENPIEPLQAVKCTGNQVPPLKVRVSIDKCILSVEIDTGASRSVMSETQFKKLWPDRALEPSSVRLQTYSKEPLTCVGQSKCAGRVRRANCHVTPFGCQG